jgi:hypothetical protein
MSIQEASRTTAQPISTRQDRVARTQTPRLEGEGAWRRDRVQTGICGGGSPGLQYYLGRYIQWPNSSSTTGEDRGAMDATPD